MCMLSVIPAGVECGDELMDELLNGCLHNPDGYGYAIVNDRGDEIIKFHSMCAATTLDRFESDRSKHMGDAIFHSRWATHGVEDERGCHPFQIGKDSRSLMAHNGVLPKSTWPQSDKDFRSDSRIFAERFLPSWGMNLDSERFTAHVEDFIGTNKIAILTVNPHYKKNLYVWGEGRGHWSTDSGAWHSNRDYVWYYTPKGAKTEGASADPFVNDGPEEDGLTACQLCGSLRVSDAWDVCMDCGSCSTCYSYATDCLCYLPNAGECYPAQGRGNSNRTSEYVPFSDTTTQSYNGSTDIVPWIGQGVTLRKPVEPINMTREVEQMLG